MVHSRNGDDAAFLFHVYKYYVCKLIFYYKRSVVVVVVALHFHACPAASEAREKLALCVCCFGNTALLGCWTERLSGIYCILVKIINLFDFCKGGFECTDDSEQQRTNKVRKHVWKV